jgi:hypothetical protein
MAGSRAEALINDQNAALQASTLVKFSVRAHVILGRLSPQHGLEHINMYLHSKPSIFSLITIFLSLPYFSHYQSPSPASGMLFSTALLSFPLLALGLTITRPNLHSRSVAFANPADGGGSQFDDAGNGLGEPFYVR